MIRCGTVCDLCLGLPPGSCPPQISPAKTRQSGWSSGMPLVPHPHHTAYCVCVRVYYCTQGGPHNLWVASAAGLTFATHIDQDHICNYIWASMWLSIFTSDLFSCPVYTLTQVLTSPCLSCQMGTLPTITHCGVCLSALRAL